MSAGTAEGDLETLASQRLRNVSVYARAINYQQALYGLIPMSVGEDVAHAAQVSFAFLANVSDENNIGFSLYLRLLQRGRHCQHGHHTRGIIADARPKEFIALF